MRSEGRRRRVFACDISKADLSAAMEGLGGLYDIGDNDLLDVWDTDFAAVRRGAGGWGGVVVFKSTTLFLLNVAHLRSSMVDLLCPENGHLYCTA